jgi:hypothetical protein
VWLYSVGKVIRWVWHFSQSFGFLEYELSLAVNYTEFSTRSGDGNGGNIRG